ncbi:MAG TPA: lysophospholipid acyltransferase family protein [Chloroflexota bacterium]|nr:lysophospholipid acyltransferase family protein [Chloroflexota bacterium]
MNEVVRLARRVTGSAGPLRQQLVRQGQHWALAGAAALLDATSSWIRRLPPSARYHIADALTWPFLLFWLPTRPAIAENYAAILGLAATHPKARRLARLSVRNYGRMAMDFLAVRTMSEAEIRAWATGAGRSNMDEALQEGHGVIMALPHLGSWDVAAAFAQSYGWKLTVVTERNWAAALVAGSRKGRGVTLAPRQGSLRLLFRALARNECVAILCDIAPEGVPTVTVPFFGRPAPFPTGPARLAQRSKAPILVASSVRLPDTTYLVEGQPLLRPDPTATPDEAVARLTAAIAAGFERSIAAHPEQWYPFHPLWPAPK